MKYQNLLLILIIAGFLLIFGACDENYNCIEGNNNVIMEERVVNYFKSVITEGNFNIEVIQDSVSKVVIEAESNYMPYIRTNVYGSILEIDTRNNSCFDPNYPIRVYVYTPDLESASIEGSGNIYCDRLQTSELYLNITGSGNIEVDVETIELHASIVGSGNIELQGTAVESSLSVSGSGSVFSYHLPVETCDVKISGSGNVYVNVNTFLNIVISGSGSVYYIGNPTITTNISGSGSVIHG